jgi:hypothetical protein
MLHAFVAAAPLEASDDELFGSGAERVDEATLADQRGGFSWEGIDIRVGAELRSYISDELVAQTNVNWADGTADVQRSFALSLTPLGPDDLRGVLSANGITMNLGSGGAYLANDGQTTLIQRTDGALQNVMLNTANGVAIRQELDARLDLSNFGPFQDMIVRDRITDTLSTLTGLAGMVY